MLVPLLRVLPLSKSENMFLVAVVCVWGGGGGGLFDVFQIGYFW